MHFCSVQWKRWTLTGIALIALSAAVMFMHPALAQDNTQALAPSRIILTWEDNPSTTQSVSWRTDVPTESAQAQIAPASPDPKLEAAARMVPARTSETALYDGRTVWSHSALFTELDPGHAYCYRVGNGETWSEWFDFRTASATPEPFRFLYFGDMQSAVYSVGSRAVRAAFRHAPDARFIIHAGDLVNRGFNDNEWVEWAHALGFIGSMIPSLPTPGNHDISALPEAPEPRIVDNVYPVWRGQFALPLNGPTGGYLDEEAYYLDYQGVRLISINSNVIADAHRYNPAKREAACQAQLEWLNEILAHNPNTWTIAFMHHPIYSTGGSRDNPELRDMLAPVFERYGVDLVLQGHDHHYGRTTKIAGGIAADPKAPGVVYAVSNIGAKMYERNPKHESLMRMMIGNTQIYQVIAVEESRIRYEAYDITGVPVDTFELRALPDGNTEFVDLAPARPMD